MHGFVVSSGSYGARVSCGTQTGAMMMMFIYAEKSVFCTESVVMRPCDEQCATISMIKMTIGTCFDCFMQFAAEKIECEGVWCGEKEEQASYVEKPDDGQGPQTIPRADMVLEGER